MYSSGQIYDIFEDTGYSPVHASDALMVFRRNTPAGEFRLYGMNEIAANELGYEAGVWSYPSVRDVIVNLTVQTIVAGAQKKYICCGPLLLRRDDGTIVSAISLFYRRIQKGIAAELLIGCTFDLAFYRAQKLELSVFSPDRQILFHSDPDGFQGLWNTRDRHSGMTLDEIADKAMRSGRSVTVDHSAGSCWYTTDIVPISDRRDRIVYLFKRKYTEEAPEELSEDTDESSPASFVFFLTKPNEVRQLAYVNPKAVRRFGYSANEWLSIHPHQFSEWIGAAPRADGQALPAGGIKSKSGLYIPSHFACRVLGFGEKNYLQLQVQGRDRLDTLMQKISHALKLQPTTDISEFLIGLVHKQILTPEEYEEVKRKVVRAPYPPLR